MKEQAMINHTVRGAPGNNGLATFHVLQRMKSAGDYTGGQISGSAIRAWGRRDIGKRRAKRVAFENRVLAMGRRITAMDRHVAPVVSTPPPPPPTPAERWEANLRRRARLERARLVIVRQNNSDARRRGYFVEPTTQHPHRRFT